MAGFGSSDDAFFGLDGEADAPVAAGDDEGFDLDRDDLSSKTSSSQPAFDMSGLDDALPGGMPGGFPGGMPPGMVRAAAVPLLSPTLSPLPCSHRAAFVCQPQPPGMEDIDPSVIQEMMGMMSGGMPDPAKLKALMKRNPALQKMMEAYAPMLGMGDGGMGGIGGVGGAPIGGGKGGGRNQAQRERLQERLRQKQGGGEVNIPEVKASGRGTGTSVGGADDDDDDWLADVPKPNGGGGGGGGKKKGGKKKGGKKK